MKRAAAKGAMSKAKKPSKPNYLPGDKVISKKEMRLATKALLLQKLLNARMKEWGKIVVEFVSTLNTECQTFMNVIKDSVNDQEGKAEEEKKELDTSWGGSNFVNLSPIFIILLVFSV